MEQCLQVEGPASHRVYQRNGEGTADISYTLLLQGATSGEIMQRLERSTEQTPWLSAGTITGSNVLRGIIGDVPTGEWTIHFRIVGEADTGFASETTVGPIFVGDLWLLAGQSNMEGCGYLADLEEPLNGVSCFYLGDRWDIAADPLTWLKESV
ncbi:sialate O-acetylesterase, partial [Paenibacillus sepulcri]|nr:sialate O-acetylesterase [Paenibacillus sepulcri]